MTPVSLFPVLLVVALLPASVPAQPVAAPAAVPPASAASAAPSTEPPTCEQRLRDYQRSQACYAPYRTAAGAVKPEAFAACGAPLPDPSGDCVQRTP